MTTGIIIAPSLASRGQKSPQPIFFHISHYYTLTTPSLPHLKKEITTLYLDPLSVTVRLDRKCRSDKHEWHRWICG